MVFDRFPFAVALEGCVRGFEVRCLKGLRRRISNWQQEDISWGQFVPGQDGSPCCCVRSIDLKKPVSFVMGWNWIYLIRCESDEVRDESENAWLPCERPLGSLLRLSSASIFPLRLSSFYLSIRLPHSCLCPPEQAIASFKTLSCPVSR